MTICVCVCEHEYMVKLNLVLCYDDVIDVYYVTDCNVCVGIFQETFFSVDGCNAGISIPLRMECHDTQKLTLHHVSTYACSTETNTSLIKCIMMHGAVTCINVYGTLKNQIQECEIICLTISLLQISFVTACVCSYACVHLSRHFSLSILNKYNSMVSRFFQRKLSKLITY
jgi:hypothetical protein